MVNSAVTSNQDIVRQLEQLGVRPGDHLGVGMSFKSVGPVEDGPRGFVAAMLAGVGSQGTVMMPAYTRLFRLSDIRKGKVDYVFNYRTTQATTGIIPETLRNFKDVVRSQHPTNSMVACGARAADLTQSHDAGAGAYWPYSKLAEIDGKILSIGIGDRLVGIRHQAQYLAGLLDIVPYKLGVEYEDDRGDRKLFVRKDKGGCVKRLPEFMRTFREMGLVTEGRIGQARASVVPAKDVLQIMTEALRLRPEINLCDDVSCLWCREVEKRLNLFAKIETPRYFQKHVLVRNALAMINRFRFCTLISYSN